MDSVHIAVVIDCGEMHSGLYHWNIDIWRAQTGHMILWYVCVWVCALIKLQEEHVVSPSTSFPSYYVAYVSNQDKTSLIMELCL